MSHTPGPWVFDPESGDITAGDEHEWEIIAHVPNPANGPVLAAAHGLLAVCQEIQRGSETWYVPGDVLDRLVFWIAKAENREP